MTKYCTANDNYARQMDQVKFFAEVKLFVCECVCVYVCMCRYVYGYVCLCLLVGGVVRSVCLCTHTHTQAHHRAGYTAISDIFQNYKLN